MGKDEEQAIELLKSSHRSQKELILKYGGKWLKEIGDGVLAEFPSALDAVKCAMEIQKSSDPGLVRIGIHLGDIFYNKGEIYGDGVNIASRIESEASPGGICISETVFQNIRNQKDIQTSSLGKRNLKNVKEPIELFQIKGEGIYTKSNLRPKSVSLAFTILLTIGISIITGIIVWFSKPLGEINSKDTKYYHIYLPNETQVALIGSAHFGNGQTAIALLPDGSTLVFAGQQAHTTQLYVRYLNDMRVIPLAGTMGAFYPFFSPDGEWVGFISENKLKKISLKENSVFTICEVSDPFGATWLLNEEIIFNDNQGATLKKVSANGGIPVVIEQVFENDAFTGWLSNPFLLPGGEKIICNIGNMGEIAIISFKNGVIKQLKGIRGISPKYISTGHIVCIIEDVLVAVPFNLTIMEITGNVYPIIKSLRTEATRPIGQYSISNDGKLAFISGSSAGLASFIWVSRSGDEIEPLSLQPDYYGTFSLSFDGTKIAYVKYPDIWVYDMKEDNKIRITNPGENFRSAWSSDDKNIAFTFVREGIRRVYQKPSNGIGEEIEFVGSEGLSVISRSRNNKYFSYLQNADIYLYSLEDNKNQLLVHSPFNETQMDFSPDGRYFVYLSDETGQMEVYVQSIPTTGERWNISHGLGYDPIWSIRGDEIFYRNSNQWFSVKVNSDNDFIPEKPALLFEGSYVDIGGKSFAVSPDCNRFLLLKQVNDEKFSNNVVIVENWFEEVKQKTAGQ
jgi:Tol biopolymer transport system component